MPLATEEIARRHKQQQLIILFIFFVFMIILLTVFFLEGDLLKTTTRSVLTLVLFARGTTPLLVVCFLESTTRELVLVLELANIIL